jgi:hypothetical protein
MHYHLPMANASLYDVLGAMHYHLPMAKTAFIFVSDYFTHLLYILSSLSFLILSRQCWVNLLQVQIWYHIHTF